MPAHRGQPHRNDIGDEPARRARGTREQEPRQTQQQRETLRAKENDVARPTRPQDPHTPDAPRTRAATDGLIVPGDADEPDELGYESDAEPNDGDGELDDDVDSDLDGDDDNVIDVEGSTGLVRRGATALPGGRGEWMRPEEQRARRAAAESRELYQAFVRYATSFARLSEEQERALGLRVRDHQDEGAAKKLVVHNLRLALKMAHQHRRAWTNLMDLVQEASAGMAIAAQRWDPDQGTRFGTYAVYWIRAQLTKFLMTHGRIIHTGSTRAGRKLYFQLPQIRRRLLAEGKEPTVAAIAAQVGESEEEVARIVSRLDGREASLSAPLGADEESGSLGDLLPGEGLSPEQRVGNEETNQLIHGTIERFAKTLSDERDRAIWREHLVADEPTSLVDLGKRFGVSKQRMGQLATRLKRAFRCHIIDELGPNTQLHWLFRQD